MAKDQEQRIGSLLFTFGGPHASSLFPSLGKEFRTLNSRYGLTSFDRARPARTRA
ncbi:hypothetical protein [Streptomyces sp. NPDC002889]|uniref:hypothetical protein n=1 Tax=Streptomyces sp. NPDC002889 TaxID=3364669 RepID=UPI003695CD1F